MNQASANAAQIADTALTTNAFGYSVPRRCAILVYFVFFCSSLWFLCTRQWIYCGGIIAGAWMGLYCAAFFQVIMPIVWAFKEVGNSAGALCVKNGTNAEQQLSPLWIVFRRIVGPWLRFQIELLPLYAIVACSEEMADFTRETNVILAIATGPKAYLCLPTLTSYATEFRPIGAGVLLMATRFIEDVIGLFLCGTLGYFLAWRCKVKLESPAIGYLTAVVVLICIFCTPEVFCYSGPGTVSAFGYDVYPVLCVLRELLKFGTIWILLRLASRACFYYRTSGPEGKKARSTWGRIFSVAKMALVAVIVTFMLRVICGFYVRFPTPGNYRFSSYHNIMEKLSGVRIAR
jgi:hypothetical protein